VKNFLKIIFKNLALFNFNEAFKAILFIKPFLLIFLVFFNVDDKINHFNIYICFYKEF